MTEKPNVVLLVIDCLRSDRVIGTGRTCRTPNIDKLVAEGTSLPNVFVENSITPPAFASLLTGRYAATHGITGMIGLRLAERVTTLAEVLAENGYQTYAEATGPLHPYIGLDKGFQRYNYRSQHHYYFTPWGEHLLSSFENREFTPPYFVMVHFWEAHVPVQVRPEFDSPEFGDTPYDRAISGLDAYFGRLLDQIGDDTAIILTGDHGECVSERPAANTLLPWFLKKMDLPPAGLRPEDSIDHIIELIAREPRLHHFITEITGAMQRGEKRLSFWRRWSLLGNLLRIGWTRYSIQAKKERFRTIFVNLKQKAIDNLLLLTVLRGRTEEVQYQLIRNSLHQHVLQHGYHIYDYLQRVPVVFMKKGLFREGLQVETDLRQIDFLPTLVDALALDADLDGMDGHSYISELSNGGGKNRPVYLEARGGAQADKIFLIRGVRRNNRKIAFAPFEAEAPVEYYDLETDPGEKINLADLAGEEANKLREEAAAIAAAFVAPSARRLSSRENLEIIKRLKGLGYL